MLCAQDDNTDGAEIYNSVGWQAGYRINSSGNVVAADGAYLTGWIPISYGETITFENMTIPSSSSATRADWARIQVADSSKASLAYTIFAGQQGETDSDGNYTKWNTTALPGIFKKDGLAFFRFSCLGIDSTSAIYIS